MLRELNRILVVRPDRLGDVILSTPAFAAIKQGFPEARLTVMVKDAFRPILEGLPFIDAFLPADHRPGVAEFGQLIRALRQEEFDAAVVLQSDKKISAAILLAGIPIRVGPLSKPHTYLAFNRGMRQSRSRVQLHEGDYNLQLLEKLGVVVPRRSIPTQVSVDRVSESEARRWLEHEGFRPGQSLVVVHPGMGGSALNWPEQNYVELIRAILKDGVKVLVTGGPSESELLGRIGQALGGRRGSALFYEGSGGIRMLAGLQSFAKLVVAPSTGPLHLAVALGKRVVTFYPDIPVQSPRRWGPYFSVGYDESRASVLVPDVNSDMSRITVEMAAAEARRHLGLGD
jgi:heptosyltransferase III